MNKQSNSESPRQLKRFTWGYFIIGIIAVVGGAYSIHSQINSFAPSLFSLDTVDEDTASFESRLAELSELDLQDSDADGLSDFDELYVYKTSQYLEDTDSDGVSDGEEISTGEDPNCATGQVCINSRSEEEQTSNVALGFEQPKLLSADLTNDELRTELEKAGISSQLLGQVADDDLRSVYESVVADYEYAVSPASTVATQNPNEDVVLAPEPEDPYADLLLNTADAPENSFYSSTTVQDLENISVDEVKDLMLQSGVSEEDINAISDSELEQLYQQTFQEEFKSLNQ
ncbi:MAG: thrombospondin type 3 repeat-containing protein [bacterium]|nr:thrombospondin type 3 repeat-containing protein [bacterium]